MEYTIDGLSYASRGEINCAHGSGDSEEKWSIQILVGPDGQEYLFNEDSGKQWLYRRVDEPKWSNSLVAKVHETSDIDVAKGGGYSFTDTCIQWVGLQERFLDAKPPFTETAQAMVMDPTGPDPAFFMSVALTKNPSGELFSARFPAEQLPQHPLAGTNLSPVSRLLEFGGAACWAALLGYGAATGASFPLTAFWWLGPIVVMFWLFMSRSNSAHALVRMVGGAFMIHFATHGVDVYLAQSWDEGQAIAFESLRGAGLFAALFLLRLAWLRGYSVAADGGVTGGGCAWLVFMAGILVVSGIAEFSYFPWFSWYAGTVPWGFVWPCFLAWGVFTKWEDYKDVAIDKRDMRSALCRVADVLEAGLDATAARCQEMAPQCDDLEDAVQISNDPGVVSLLALGPGFHALRDAIKNLESVDLSELTDSERQLLDSDLKTAGKDLKAILADFRSWGSQGVQYQSVRVSPFLLTYGQ